MPSPILTMDIAVNLTGGFPPLVLDTRLTPQWSGAFDPLLFDPSVFTIDWDNSQQLQLLTSLDSSLAESAFPRASRHQLIPPWRISVGGVDIPWYRLLSGVTFRESIDGTTQFSFSMPRRGVSHDPYTEPLGNPRSWLGVPGGKGAVNITAEFLTQSGRKSVPLVRDGLLDNTSGDTSPDRDVRTWNGGGAHARVDRVPVTYQAPPGHGQTSGTVVRRLLELAGVPPSKIAISGGRRLYKEISVIDGNAIQVANDILLPESRRVYHDDRSDTWQTMDYSGVSGKRVEAVITEDDVLAVLGSLGDGAASDAPTSIVLTSTGQVTRDECGRRVEYKITEIFTIRGIAGAHYLQAFGYPVDPPATTQNSEGQVPGSLVAMTQWQGRSADLRLTSLIIDIVEIDCETVIAEESVEWGWRSVQGAKYIRDVDGSIDYYHSGYIYDSGAAQDDSSPVYVWPSERFIPIAWNRREKEFSDEGFLTKTLEYQGRWEEVDSPIKDKDDAVDGTPWSQIPYAYHSATADGRGVETQVATGTFSGRHFLNAEGWRGPSKSPNDDSGRLVSVGPPRLPYGNQNHAELTTQIDDVRDGLIHVSSISTQSHIIRDSESGRWLYSSGAISNDPSPVYVQSSSKRVMYSGSSEDRHNEVVTDYDHNGDVVGRRVDRNLPGYLPAADQRTDIVPPASTFDDPAEAEFALAASRNESRPLKVEVSAPALTSVLIPWAMKGVVVQYAENEDDLAAVGIQMMRELSSIEVRVPLPFNPLLRPGHRLILSMPSVGIHYDFLVEIADHRQDESETWTQITGRQDVI